MSHCSTQILDWYVAALTGVAGLPAAVKGSPKQIASNTAACLVWPTTESIGNPSVGLTTLQQRLLQIDVTLIAASFAAADVLSVLAENKIAATASPLGERMDLTGREYIENRESDRDYVAITLSYSVSYLTAWTDAETFA